jgi:hypothetical protein
MAHVWLYERFFKQHERRNEMKMQPQRMRSAVVFADGRRIEVEEPLSVQMIVADAKRAGAAKVELENGTEIYLNEKGDQK